jgi:hypothetical protein
MSPSNYNWGEIKNQSPTHLFFALECPKMALGRVIFEKG